MTLYDTQLQWIIQLQSTLRSAWMDGFFIAWNYVDTIYFSIILITSVWYLFDRRTGIRLFYILVINTVVNFFLKRLFDLPRPCQIDPSVGILCFLTPGFPSGAAQTAALLCGIVILESQRVLYRWLIVIFALFLCFSRVYLGVHYFTDILGGVFVGGLIVLFYKKVFPYFEKFWKGAAIALSFFLLFLGFILSATTSWSIYWFFSTLGIASGLITYEKIKMRKITINLYRRIGQFLSVVVGLGFLMIAEKILPDLKILWFFAEGYWLSFLGGWLFSPRK
jgi:membrane-associated phospholipid phosphatase